MIAIVEMPIKCPVAPLEFAFLVEAFLAERGVRDKTEIVYATPLDGAFTKPRAAQAFGSMMEDRGIEVVTGFNASAVDNDGHALVAYDGRQLAFDLRNYQMAGPFPDLVTREPFTIDARMPAGSTAAELRLMLRSLLLYLSNQPRIFKFVRNNGLAKSFARRFVAGETLDEALDAARALDARGISASLDELGESVTNEAEARGTSTSLEGR